MPFVDIRDLELLEPLAGWKGKLVQSQHMSLMHYAADADADPIPEHRHGNEEVWTVIEGELEITIDGVTQIAGPGCVAIVPPNGAHAVKALGVCRAVVVNYPNRRSLAGGDAPPTE